MKKSTILQNAATYNEASHTEDVGIGVSAFDYLHYHDLYEINLVLSGEEDIFFSNSHVVLKQHELCIFRPYEIHRRLIKNPGDTSQLSIAVKRECMEHAVSFLGEGIEPAPLFNTTGPFIRRIHSADMKIIYEHSKDL